MIVVQIILIAVGPLLADADECSCRCNNQHVCEAQNTLTMDQEAHTAKLSKWNKRYNFMRDLAITWQNQVAHVVRQQLEVGMNETLESLKDAFKKEVFKLKEDLTARMESLENSTLALHDRSGELDVAMEMLSNQMSKMRTALDGIPHRSKCTVDFNNGEGNTSSVLVWPWMAAVYRKEAFSTKHKCSGSVIHRHFVLTSAYCIDKFGSAGLSVKLGLNDLKNATHLQEYRVESTHMHPQFRTGPGKFDQNFHYDIALLELEEPITFGPFVRPVCLLPPEITQDDTFYKPQSTAKAVRLSDYLSSPLTESPTVWTFRILPQEECRRVIKETEMEENFPSPDLSFCGESSAYLCPEYGSPLMESRLRGDGTRTWTQVGIASYPTDWCKVDSLSPRLDRLRAWMDAAIAASSKV